jgi:hypothetical protein
MTANQLVQKLGSKLLGKKVNTLAAGQYPGGVATVIGIAPDAKAPEVVFQVNIGHWGPIGVAGHEDVSLLSDNLGVIQLHENWRN